MNQIIWLTKYSVDQIIRLTKKLFGLTIIRLTKLFGLTIIRLNWYLVEAVSTLIISNTKIGLTMDANQLKPPRLMKSYINFELYTLE